MSRTLFIGNQRDPTGWGEACRRYLGALDRAGVDVVARHVKMGPSVYTLSGDLNTLHLKDTVGVDSCIQVLLPHLYEPYGGFRKNVGVLFTETSNFSRTDWADHCNLMTELWVPTESVRDCCRASGVTVPIHVIGVPCDVTRYQVPMSPIGLRDELGDRFLFLFVGEMNRRKNLRALLTAFHTEFTPDEPVELLIKTSPVGLDHANPAASVQSICSGIKEGFGLYPRIEDYKKEYVITDYVTDNQLLRIHKTADCLVATSYGEGWHLPTLDHMGLGGTVICPQNSAFLDYSHTGNSISVTCGTEPVFVNRNEVAIPNLFTSGSDWWPINIRELQRAMRAVYGWKDAPFDNKQAVSTAYRFSYERVGLKMKRLLEST